MELHSTLIAFKIPPCNLGEVWIHKGGSCTHREPIPGAEQKYP